MDKVKLWIKRRENYQCAGCGDKLKVIKDFLCVSCNNTHPHREDINVTLEKHFSNEVDKNDMDL